MKHIWKQLLKNLAYMAIGISVVLNLLFAASVIYKIDIRKNAEKYKGKLKFSLKKILGKQNSKKAGRWRTLSPHLKERTLTSQQELAIEQLESIGYLSGSRIAPRKKAVTIYDKNLAYKGLNLYVSGHAAEAILTDLDGNELYKWGCNFSDIWPYYKPPASKLSENHEFWRRVHLFENGNLLAIFEGIGLIKLDKDSNLLWAFNGKAHHDLYVTAEGKIYVLTRKAWINPKYDKEYPILEDFITVLSPNGSEIRQVSVLKSIENSNYAPVLNKMKKRRGDILHTNTIEVLDGRLEHRCPAFREGNVMICIPKLDLVCVVDLDIESVVWVLSGLWRSPHQPTVLQNGNMIIFDNWGNGGKSRVIEFDPFSQEVFWIYSGDPELPLYSLTCGSCAQLPNGNILISESDAGRALEVTPDKTIVWEFLNPNRAGDNNELIATIFEAIRLGPDFQLDWLDNNTDNN